MPAPVPAAVPVSICIALTVVLIRILNPNGKSDRSVFIATVFYSEQVDLRTPLCFCTLCCVLTASRMGVGAVDAVCGGCCLCSRRTRQVRRAPGLWPTLQCSWWS